MPGLVSYKLDDVAQSLLGTKKEDVNSVYIRYMYRDWLNDDNNNDNDNNKKGGSCRHYIDRILDAESNEYETLSSSASSSSSSGHTVQCPTVHTVAVYNNKDVYLSMMLLRRLEKLLVQLSSFVFESACNISVIPKSNLYTQMFVALALLKEQTFYAANLERIELTQHVYGHFHLSLEKVTRDGYVYGDLGDVLKKKVGSGSSTTTTATTYKGAINYCKKLGIYRKVIAGDILSSYPYAAVGRNISVETCDILSGSALKRLMMARDATSTAGLCIFEYTDHDDCANMWNSQTVPTAITKEAEIKDDGLYVVSLEQPRGILAGVWMYLLDERQNIKLQMKHDPENAFLKNQQLVVKILINSLYGTFGMSSNRFAYAPRVTVSITMHARCALVACCSAICKLGFEPIYADTDSCFFSTYSDYTGNSCDSGSGGGGGCGGGCSSNDGKSRSRQPRQTIMTTTSDDCGGRSVCDAVTESLRTVSYGYIKFQYEDTFDSMYLICKKKYGYSKLEEGKRVIVFKCGGKKSVITKSYIEQIASRLLLLDNDNDNDDYDDDSRRAVAASKYVKTTRRVLRRLFDDLYHLIDARPSAIVVRKTIKTVSITNPFGRLVEYMKTKNYTVDQMIGTFPIVGPDPSVPTYRPECELSLYRATDIDVLAVLKPHAKLLWQVLQLAQCRYDERYVSVDKRGDARLLRAITGSDRQGDGRVNGTLSSSRCYNAFLHTLKNIQTESKLRFLVGQAVKIVRRQLYINRHSMTTSNISATTTTRLRTTTTTTRIQINHKYLFRSKYLLWVRLLKELKFNYPNTPIYRLPLLKAIRLVRR
jgi:hypothetical protein